MLDPKEGKIRTCILAKRHFNIFLLRNYSNGDNTAVSLELESGSIRVLSAYLAFEKENPPDALVRGLAEECEKLRKGLVIGCGANAHHTQWGCPSNKGRGESLFDFILNSNIFLCKVPTFITKACQTIIDLTLVSDSLDNTGLHPISRTNSHKLVEENLPIHPGGRRITNSMVRNKGGFHSQGREGHSHHSKGF